MLIWRVPLLEIDQEVDLEAEVLLQTKIHHLKVLIYQLYRKNQQESRRPQSQLPDRNQLYKLPLNSKLEGRAKDLVERQLLILADHGNLIRALISHYNRLLIISNL